MVEFIFEVFYKATYFQIFTDNDTINEAALKNFLFSMKEIYMPITNWEEIEEAPNKIDDHFSMNGLIESLNQSVDMDAISRDIMLEQVHLYLNDSISLDTAVAEIVKKIKLVIAERS